MSSSNQRSSEADEPTVPEILFNNENGLDSNTSLEVEIPLVEVFNEGGREDSSIIKEEVVPTDTLQQTDDSDVQPVTEESTMGNAMDSNLSKDDDIPEAIVEENNSASSQNSSEASGNTTPKENKPIVEIIIPNPMCQVEYSYSLAHLIGQEEVISVIASDNDGDMTYDESDKSMVGKPQTARNYWSEIELGNKVLHVKCYINDNPRLLWKDIPSDQIVKPDKDYYSILSPGLDMVAVSHRGRMHANIGTNRDDDFYIGKVGKFTLSIVADGAGSSPRSSTGSKVFCREAGSHFAKLVAAKQKELLVMLNDMQHHPEDLKRDQKFMLAFYEIFPATALYGRKVLTKMAEDNQIPLKHYHTTALLSMTVEIAQDSYFCAAFQVGDGVTMALTSQQFKQLGEGDSGNFPGETVFVTSNGVFDDAKALLNRIQFFFCKEKPTVVSMTDGVSESYFKLPVGTLASDTFNIDNDIKFNAYPQLDNFDLWKQFLSEVKDAYGYLKPAAEICDWLNYYVDKEHDDRTVSIIMYK